MTHTPAIEFVGIDKRFGAVHANRAVSFAIGKGSIHGIIGENGAGKSTLMSVLFGFYQADAGAIKVDGQEVQIPNSETAIRLGIGMVHQHFMLIEPFTVLENVVLGVEGGLQLKAGKAAARAKLASLNSAYGLNVDPDAIVGKQPVGVQQRVEILKTLYRDARILILDEPTAVLTPQETTQLFAILRTLRDEGKTIVLITHKLREIMEVTDTVTVMRAGAVVAQVATSETSQEQLAELMVGRKVTRAATSQRAATQAAPVLEVTALSLTDARGVKLLDNVSFHIKPGEIVGLAGVSGNGQSELMEILAGMQIPTAGAIAYQGKDIGHRPGQRWDAHTPARFRAMGIAHVPEDRLHEGMVKSMSAFENAALGYQDDKDLQRGPLLPPAGMIERCRKFISEFDVRPANPFLRAALFSGGNQQKLVLAREIDRDPTLLLIGQPTRGVDIGAIEFIHRRIMQLRDAGKAILLVSSELEEILALSDRVLVISSGHLSESAANEQEIGLRMAGVVA
ncbi:MAG TPA: ABC transporter ATP-binding protein [Burkholderiaceae bacterium]